jgi:Family of unknown function (DUF6101)
MSVRASLTCIANACCCGAARGMPMALNLPLSAFRGIAIRPSGKPDESPSSIAIVLEHGDPALSLPLFSSPEIDDIVEEWQSWGWALGLPPPVADRDGGLREPFARLGAVRIEAPTWRRRRRSAMAWRRPQRLLRRCPGAPLLQRRSFIGASARSSRGIDALTGCCSSEQR